MELEEKITAIERMLDQLSKPPEDIPNCEVVIERVCCEKHGEYEQRKRILTSSIINLPSPPTRCPGCLEDELSEHCGSARPTHRNGLIASSRAVGWLCVASLVPVKTTLRWPLPVM